MVRVRAGEPKQSSALKKLARFYLFLCSIFIFSNQIQQGDIILDKQTILIAVCPNIMIPAIQVQRRQSDLEALGNWCIPRSIKPAQKRWHVNAKSKLGRANGQWGQILTLDNWQSENREALSVIRIL